MAQVLDVQADVRVGHDHLPGFARCVRDEPGAQGGVACHQSAQRCGERRHVERALDGQRQRHVVERTARGEPVEEPQALLGVGQPVRALAGRCQRRVVLRAVRGGQPGGEPFDGGCLEHVPHPGPGAEPGFDA